MDGYKQVLKSAISYSKQNRSLPQPPFRSKATYSLLPSCLAGRKLLRKWSILINVLYVCCKNGKKFYNLFICETIFQAFRHAFLIFVASSLLANSHIFEISEMTTHGTTHGNTRPRSLMNFTLR
jgi:hypothetical protein